VPTRGVFWREFARSPDSGDHAVPDIYVSTKIQGDTIVWILRVRADSGRRDGRGGSCPGQATLHFRMMRAVSVQKWWSRIAVSADWSG